ncbi:MAG: aminoacyl-tRNA hydrolase [Thermoguttaceae bacterium]|nr:aminoacyl-tRNA hydrolase [Thermoguttaceae bacterium]
MLKALLTWVGWGSREIMKPDRIVVGLGNPGPQYKGTRHNVGFMVLAELAKRHAQGKARDKFQAQIYESKCAGQNTLLLCPTTYMNLSGQSVAAAASFYKLEPEHILVVCDDLDLPVGRLRLREKGSSGGQKGLKSITERLGTDSFARLRVGIGRPDPGMDAADYVLSTFRPDEKKTMADSLVNAVEAVECWLAEGMTTAMNRFNG